METSSRIVRDYFVTNINDIMCIVNSPKFHGNRFVTLARQSGDSLAKYFGKKIRTKFLNIFKTFATSSLHMKIFMTGMSCESSRQDSRNSREEFACQ